MTCDVCLDDQFPSRIDADKLICIQCDHSTCEVCGKESAEHNPYFGLRVCEPCALRSNEKAHRQTP